MASWMRVSSFWCHVATTSLRKQKAGPALGSLWRRGRPCWPGTQSWCSRAWSLTGCGATWSGGQGRWQGWTLSWRHQSRLDVLLHSRHFLLLLKLLQLTRCLLLPQPWTFLRWIYHIRMDDWWTFDTLAVASSSSVSTFRFFLFFSCSRFLACVGFGWVGSILWFFQLALRIPSMLWDFGQELPSGQWPWWA